MDYEKELSRISFEGRSTVISSREEGTLFIFVVEGIVYKGEIFWRLPDFPGATIAGTQKVVVEKGFLKPGQKVTLLLKSILDDNPDIIPEAYDDFLKKIYRRKKRIAPTIRELVIVRK